MRCSCCHSSQQIWLSILLQLARITICLTFSAANNNSPPTHVQCHMHFKCFLHPVAIWKFYHTHPSPCHYFLLSIRRRAFVARDETYVCFFPSSGSLSMYPFNVMLYLIHLPDRSRKKTEQTRTERYITVMGCSRC